MKLFFVTIVCFLYFQFTDSMAQNILVPSADTSLNTKEFKTLVARGDSLFKAQDYTASMSCFEKALALKPKAKYPKFKIEDIRTLYIKKKIEEQKKKDEEIRIKKEEEKKESFFEKRKRLKAEEEQKEAKEKEIAQAKIKADEESVKKAKQDEEAKVKIENEKRENEKKIKENEAKQKALEQLKAKEETEAKQKAADEKKAREELDVRIKAMEEKRAKEEQEAQRKKDEEAKAKAEQEIRAKAENEKKTRDEQEKRLKQQAVVFSENRPDEDEDKLLAAKYPNEKTVETINEPTKIITQVIINRNGKVTIYLKVQHSWGATYYFIKEPKLALTNISQDYYERAIK